MHGLLLLLMLTAAEPATLHTRIKGTLTESLQKAEPSAGEVLAMQVARLVRWQGEPARKIHSGDEITAVYIQEPGTMAELVALRYQGLEVNIDAYRFQDIDGMHRFFDAQGVRYEPTINNSPTTYAQVTEWMQSQRRGQRGHKGIDLKADNGTPIIAPFAGTITRVNWSKRVNGLCIEMTYPGGKLARFLHLSEVTPGITRGTHVHKGQTIARVGSTGRSSAPHLHYEIEGPHGSPVDPLKLHGTSAPLPLATAQLPAFHTTRAHYQRLIEGATCRMGPCYAKSTAPKHTP